MVLGKRVREEIPLVICSPSISFPTEQQPSLDPPFPMLQSRMERDSPPGPWSKVKPGLTLAHGLFPGMEGVG